MRAPRQRYALTPIRSKPSAFRNHFLRSPVYASRCVKFVNEDDADLEKVEQLLLASGQGVVSVQASPDAQGTPEMWHEWLKDLRFLFKASVSR